MRIYEERGTRNGNDDFQVKSNRKLRLLIFNTYIVIIIVILCIVLR